MLSMKPFEYLAICIVISGKGKITVENQTLGVSDQYEADTFSTWYIAPGSKVGLEIASDSNDYFKVFFAAPF